MRGRARWLVVLLSLVAGAALWWTLAGGGTSRDADTLRRGSAEGLVAEDGEEAARLTGRTRRDDGARRAAAPTEASPTRDGSVRVLLRGEVLGIGDEATVFIDAQTRTGSMDSLDLPGLGTEREGPGAFELDVTELIGYARDRALREPPQLLVDAICPGFVCDTVPVPLPAFDDLLGGRATLEPIRLELRRAAILRGLVRLLDGTPARLARLLLHRLAADGPQSEAVAEGWTDFSGRFELATAGRGRHFLVAAWRDFEPTTTRVTHCPLPEVAIVDLEIGRVVEGVELRLARSRAIAGRVLVDGEPGDWATVGWRLAGEARPLRGVQDARYDDADLWVLDGAVHWAGDPVRTDDQGRFRLLGASPVPYRVFVDDVLAGHLHTKSKREAEIEVTPPAHDIMLDLRLAKLVLAVRHRGEPLSLDTKIALCGMGMDAELGDDVCWATTYHGVTEAGNVELGLTPGHAYSVVVQEPGYEQWWKQLTAPAAGETLELVADLESARPKPRLEVTLEGEAAEAIQTCAFGFYEPDVDPMSRTPFPVRTVEAEDGRFVLDDLLPGRFRLHVRPGREWFGVESDWVEAVVPVDIPVEGMGDLVVPVARGGRLLLDVRDADGRSVRCSCTIRGPGGETLAVYFLTKTDDGGSIMSRDLPGEGAAWVDRALAPGRYEVVLSREGHPAERREVEIVAGTPATLRLRLDER